MKKITILSLLLYVFCVVHAQNQNHKCNFMINSQTKHAFWLFVDDVQLNQQPVKSINVKELSQGEHYIRVELDNAKHNTIGQFLTLGKTTTTYCVVQKNGLYGLVALNANIYPEMTTTYPNNQQPSNHDGVQPNNQPMPMSNHDFEQALQMLENETYDNTRLNISKQISNNNILSVSQIKQICQLFSFENNKLNFAKHAYNNCADKQNYYKLNDIFKYDSDKNEFNHFLENQ